MDRIYHRLEAAAAAAAAASMTILRVQTNDQSPRMANEKHASLSSVVNARLLLTFAHRPLTGAIACIIHAYDCLATSCAYFAIQSSYAVAQPCDPHVVVFCSTSLSHYNLYKHSYALHNFFVEAF